MFTVHAKAEYKVEYNIVVDVNCQAVISVPFVKKKLLNIKPCIVAHSTTAVGHRCQGRARILVRANLRNVASPMLEDRPRYDFRKSAYLLTREL